MINKKTSPRMLTSSFFIAIIIFLVISSSLIEKSNEKLNENEPQHRQNEKITRAVEHEQISSHPLQSSITDTTRDKQTAKKTENQENITLQLSKTSFDKGKPITFNASFYLPAKSMLNATILLELEPTSILAASLPSWPSLLTIMPTLENESLYNSESQPKLVSINGSFGPYITDLNTQGRFALNTINNGFEPHGIPSWAKYRLLRIQILNKTNNDTLPYLSEKLDPPIEFEIRSINEHVLLSLVYADDEFWKDYGDPIVILNETIHRSFNYQDRNISLWDEWRIRFHPLVLNWSTIQPLNISNELPRLSSIAKNSLGLQGNWRSMKGTAPENHGFDNIMGLTGRENEGEILGGIAYVNGSVLVVDGGWNFIIKYTYSRDIIRKIIIHEFIHNLGFYHVESPGWLMSPQVGGWRMHNNTHDAVEKNKGRFDGIMYENFPIAPHFNVELINSSDQFITGQLINISWNVITKQLGGAITQYEIQWSLTEDFKTTHSQIINQAKYYMFTTEQPGTYHFRIRSINKWGLTSDWSSPLKLEIKQGKKDGKTITEEKRGTVVSFILLEPEMLTIIFIITAIMMIRKRNN